MFGVFCIQLCQKKNNVGLHNPYGHKLSIDTIQQYEFFTISLCFMIFAHYTFILATGWVDYKIYNTKQCRGSCWYATFCLSQIWLNLVAAAAVLPPHCPKIVTIYARYIFLMVRSYHNKFQDFLVRTPHIIVIRVKQGSFEFSKLYTIDSLIEVEFVLL